MVIMGLCFAFHFCTLKMLFGGVVFMLFFSVGSSFHRVYHTPQDAMKGNFFFDLGIIFASPGPNIPPFHPQSDQ